MTVQPLAATAAAAAKSVARSTLDIMRAHTPAAIAKSNDLVATHGQGSWVFTSNGEKYLDMTSGIGVVSTGHCHPKVVAAVQAQAARIVHAQQNVFAAHEPYAQLCSRLSGILPAHLSQYFLCNSGAEAIENAIKLARAHTGRQGVIAFEGGYHGRTMGSMALTSSKNVYMAGFGPLMPGVHVNPYPYCLHCKARLMSGRTLPGAACGEGGGGQDCCNGPLESLAWMLKMQTSPRDIAAIVVEPILGEGGFLTPPPGFLQGVRKVCDEHGIMLIFDEVQSGVCRSGKWWGYQNFPGVEPDMLVFAKGIASGYPMAGLAAREGAFDNCTPGSMGGTYGGNAVVCAAAVATIDVLHEEDVLGNVNARGTQLRAGLNELANSPASRILDIRGRGLMLGVEFGSQDGATITADKGVAARIVKACHARKMLLLSAGARETVRFLPPLTITESEVDQALETFAGALKDVASASA
ncbi:MAG: hypothetical protein WDW36_008367 [Sanguina aurantia]